MVDTIDPVSRIQGTETPTSLTVTLGQGATKHSISLSITGNEPNPPPPNVWLLTVGGASFPSAEG